MSRFDDLDHKIGRHAERPNPDCSYCNPGLPAFTAARDDRWDHDTLSAPPFPSWGTVWNHRGELVTFVNPTPGVLKPKETDARNMGGFWTPIHNGGLLHAKDPIPMAKLWTQEPTQMEMGSGEWHDRVRMVGINNTIPDEAGLKSPLGVNLAQWAKDQNLAKIIVEMNQKRLFPVSEVEHEQSTIALTGATMIHSTVMTIGMQPLMDFLST